MFNKLYLFGLNIYKIILSILLSFKYIINLSLKYVSNLQVAIGEFIFLEELSKILTKKFYFVYSINKKIIKQNKVLTPRELLYSVVSSKNNRSKFYTPLNSFLPFFLSASVFIILINLVAIFFRDNKVENKNWFLFLCVLFLALSISLWFSVFWFEKKTGKHLSILKRNIIWGFYLFIFTEGLCFLALFWTFLHSNLAASLHVGVFCPGDGVVNFYISEILSVSKNWNVFSYHTWGTPSYYNLSYVYNLNDLNYYSYKKKVYLNVFDSGSLINPWGLPAINTLILLTSAATLNASHCYVLLTKYFFSGLWLLITIVLGLLFVFMQFKEYKNCLLNYNDGIFASCFFGITGLHGIHVILGVFALFICFLNLLLNNYSSTSHQSFYFSIFYWHFVDVIWIFVWAIIYFWPGSFFFKNFYLSCYDINLFVFNMTKHYVVHEIKQNCWNNFILLDDCFYSKDKGSLNKVFFYNVFKNIDIFIPNWERDINEYNLKIFYKTIKIYSLEQYYILVNFLEFFNFFKLKIDVKYVCFLFTEIHSVLELNSVNPITNDVNNKYFRFLLCAIFKILNLNFINNIYMYFLFSIWYKFN